MLKETLGRGGLKADAADLATLARLMTVAMVSPWRPKKLPFTLLAGWDPAAACLLPLNFHACPLADSKVEYAAATRSAGHAARHPAPAV